MEWNNLIGLMTTNISLEKYSIITLSGLENYLKTLPKLTAKSTKEEIEKYNLMLAIPIEENLRKIIKSVLVDNYSLSKEENEFANINLQIYDLEVRALTEKLTSAEEEILKELRVKSDEFRKL